MEALTEDIVDKSLGIRGSAHTSAAEHTHARLVVEGNLRPALRKAFLERILVAFAERVGDMPALNSSPHRKFPSDATSLRGSLRPKARGTERGFASKWLG